MTTLRSRVTAWAVRKYLPRKLMPLHRDELDPVAALGATREREPVSKVSLPFVGVNVWLVTGYEEAKTVLGKAKQFSNDFTRLSSIGLDFDDPGGLGFTDPPAHTRMRKMLTPEFTMRRLSRLTPRITEIVNDQLDEIAASAQPVDLMEHFALPIPSKTICELLGMPYDQREEFQRLSTERFDLFNGATESIGAMSEAMEYLRETVRAERKNPGEGLLGMLVREHGDNVDDEELTGLADGLLTGGLETTTSMLALGAIVLLRDRDTFELIRTDDEVVPGFVEELLRYLTVVQAAFLRFALEDMEIGGKRIAKDDIVIVSLSGADRDPAILPEGRTDETSLDTFDPRRPSTSHLAFGYGIHRCVGAELAKMELRAAYPALVRRFPNMRLAKDSTQLPYRKASIVYGVESLPVVLD
ncbi:cytochrome P450 [Sciscionella sediminilitoris]|uniref:cytochrome P450 n=1 Tax=Sciscionella sediminilitoris TaxID=1445613 RepID=UPI0004DF6B6C|nr:cytochrome P450 [Sciscionella sp. SE31]